MKTLLALLITAASFGQVGINTTDPRATLHVSGDVIVDSLPYTAEGYVIVSDSINRLRQFCPNCKVKMVIDKKNRLWFIREKVTGEVDTLKIENR